MNKRWLLLGCLLAFVSQAQEAKKELWKWTDANGVVHYSDVPGPGAVRVDLKIIEGQPAPATAPAPAAPRAPASAAAAKATTYSSLEILSPEQESSFFGADATVNVRIRSDPGVSPDDRMRLSLDGKRVEGPENSLEYTLANLDRGAHTLTASIFDSKGQEKIRSRPVVFYIKQASIIPPGNVGPNLKPAPRGGG